MCMLREVAHCTYLFKSVLISSLTMRLGRSHWWQLYPRTEKRMCFQWHLPCRIANRYHVQMGYYLDDTSPLSSLSSLFPSLPLLLLLFLLLSLFSGQGASRKGKHPCRRLTFLWRCFQFWGCLGLFHLFLCWWIHLFISVHRDTPIGKDW